VTGARGIPLPPWFRPEFAGWVNENQPAALSERTWKRPLRPLSSVFWSRLQRTTWFGPRATRGRPPSVGSGQPPSFFRAAGL